VMRLVRIALALSLLAGAICLGQEAKPSSGALVALSSGQTIWIAPINGKMQAIARDELVIPRKDGFWRIRVDETQWPDTAGSNSDSADASAKPAPIIGKLWSVPLSRGPDAVPWEAKPAKENDEKKADADSENSADSLPSQDDTVYQRDLNFLSPDYISLYTVVGEYSDAYSILRITGPAPGTSVLQVQDEPPSIPEAQEKRDLANCADPNDELSNQDFLQGATEVSYGIVRGRRSWDYVWLLGYEGGVARGYHTGCPTSGVPPRSVVGVPDTFPSWRAIKEVFPEAQDAFTSPAHDVVMVVLSDRLIVAPLHNGVVGKSVLRLEIKAKPAMVQWALGKYVEQWTRILTPYFGAYQPKGAASPP